MPSRSAGTRWRGRHRSGPPPLRPRSEGPRPQVSILFFPPTVGLRGMSCFYSGPGRSRLPCSRLVRCYPACLSRQPGGLWNTPARLPESPPLWGPFSHRTGHGPCIFCLPCQHLPGGTCWDGVGAELELARTDVETHPGTKLPSSGFKADHWSPSQGGKAGAREQSTVSLYPLPRLSSTTPRV